MPTATLARPDPAPALAELRQLLGDRLSTAAAVREQHGKDLTYHDGHPPDAVAFPTSTDEVAAIVRTCAAHRLPVIAYGTGTSLEGHIAALEGGVTIDLAGLDRILEVNAEDLDARVEAGVTRKRAQRAPARHRPVLPRRPRRRRLARRHGCDPGERHQRRPLRHHARERPRPHRRHRRRLASSAPAAAPASPRPATTSPGSSSAPRAPSASSPRWRCASTASPRRSPPRSARSRPSAAPSTASSPPSSPASPSPASSSSTRCRCGRPTPTRSSDYPEAPTLFFEFHGSAASVEEQARTVAELADGLGGGAFQWTAGTEERNRLWSARHDVFWSQKALRPGAEAWATDVCVPISRLADAILAADEDAAAAGLVAPIVGHVGDGNFHMTFLLDPSDRAALAAAAGVNARLVERAIAMGGTCTGEHGVGSGKMRYLEAEHGDALALMRTIKRALDPLDILNPGKVVRLDPDAPFLDR